MSETESANELGRQLGRQIDLFNRGMLLLFVVLSIAIFTILDTISKNYAKAKKESFYNKRWFLIILSMLLSLLLIILFYDLIQGAFF